jgi:hypothetical protein
MTNPTNRFMPRATCLQLPALLLTFSSQKSDSFSFRSLTAPKVVRDGFCRSVGRTSRNCCTAAMMPLHTDHRCSRHMMPQAAQQVQAGRMPTQISTVF